MSFPWGRRAVLAALASGTLLVAGCATETTFHPATGQGFYRTGFSEQQLEPNRFRVTFGGNSVTSRDTVEKYLLFRAAQLTLQQGYDYFVMADRDTDRQQEVYSTPGFGPGYGFGGFGGYWGPSWRYYGRGFGPGFGWGPWGPWGGGFDDFDIQSVQRYEASAEIVMRKGPIPAGNVRAFDARAVVATIGPSVVLPKDR